MYPELLREMGWNARTARFTGTISRQIWGAAVDQVNHASERENDVGLFAHPSCALRALRYQTHGFVTYPACANRDIPIPKYMALQKDIPLVTPRRCLRWPTMLRI